MYDQFDKKLSDRIKHVFEVYEDDSSGMGWKKLRKNFPDSTVNRRPLVYWLSVAASALLLLGTWAYLEQRGNVVRISKTPVKTDQKQHAIEKNYASKDPQRIEKQLPVDASRNSITSNSLADRSVSVEHEDPLRGGKVARLLPQLAQTPLPGSLTHQPLASVCVRAPVGHDRLVQYLLVPVGRVRNSVHGPEHGKFSRR